MCKHKLSRFRAAARCEVKSGALSGPRTLPRCPAAMEHAVWLLLKRCLRDARVLTACCLSARA
eukprot:7254812-Lingulodinium_polyedra.AAC.1